MGPRRKTSGEKVRLPELSRRAVIAGASVATLGAAKPHPDALLGTISLAGGDKERAIMIGDSEVDVATAKAARVPVVAVSFGYTQIPVADLSPDRIIDDYQGLVPAIRDLHAAFRLVQIADGRDLIVGERELEIGHTKRIETVHLLCVGNKQGGIEPQDAILPTPISGRIANQQRHIANLPSPATDRAKDALITQSSVKPGDSKLAESVAVSQINGDIICAKSSLQIETDTVTAGFQR